MAVKIFAKISYNINGVASPSIIYASAWTDELNKLDSDERKIANFIFIQEILFFKRLGSRIPNIIYPDASAVDAPIDADTTQEELFSMFGFVANEKYPFNSYMPVIGGIGEEAVTEKLAFIMNNLAHDTLSESANNSEPAKAFFYIHKAATDEIDSFMADHPAIDEVNASVTDFYDLLSPCIATKNDTLEANGYQQATQNGNAIVLYADSITYVDLSINNPDTRPLYDPYMTPI